MNKVDKFDWNSFEKDALKRLMKGDELTGEDGILTPLIQRLLQASLNGEMQAHVIILPPSNSQLAFCVSKYSQS